MLSNGLQILNIATLYFHILIRAWIESRDYFFKRSNIFPSKYFFKNIGIFKIISTTNIVSKIFPRSISFQNFSTEHIFRKQFNELLNLHYTHLQPHLISRFALHLANRNKKRNFNMSKIASCLVAATASLFVRIKIKCDFRHLFRVLFESPNVRLNLCSFKMFQNV